MQQDDLQRVGRSDETDKGLGYRSVSCGGGDSSVVRAPDS